MSHKHNIRGKLRVDVPSPMRRPRPVPIPMPITVAPVGVVYEGFAVMEARLEVAEVGVF